MNAIQSIAVAAGCAVVAGIGGAGMAAVDRDYVKARDEFKQRWPSHRYPGGTNPGLTLVTGGGMAVGMLGGVLAAFNAPGVGGKLGAGAAALAAGIGAGLLSDRIFRSVQD